jgi:hypothetical protein
VDEGFGKPGGEQRPAGARDARWSRPGRLLRDLEQLALILLVAAAAALLLLPASDDGLLGIPELRLGEPAPRTIKSPRAMTLRDGETTEALRRRAAAAVLPIYDLSTALGAGARERLELAFAAPRNPAGPPLPARPRADEPELRERARSFMIELGVALEEDAVLPLLSGPADELRDATLMVSTAAHEWRLVEDRALLLLHGRSGIRIRLLDAEGRPAREEDLADYREVEGLDAARARVDELVATELKRFAPEQRRAASTACRQCGMRSPISG